ncbi:hypothetical protein PPL_06100 [Heterostelium album PN500]|uniref:O-methyltransferase n=1 Tax=Heterostelium pallidum (strain ATCC 26659 / Pp 5 / PN500) TaxID=670386 RepID=D3BC78_HETP5|nr:hypothetical protein PPL_06100 [Heterostelium album PN500]EFA81261.1 hypothetical protein PPL_06100 [Heterostelium album PN500]|eukprot:XP_020433379.1 hypothetical protein PPL_06100 [Heterostelium album PN500]
MDTIELVNSTLPSHLKMTPEGILMRTASSYLVTCALYSVIKLEIYKEFDEGPRSIFEIAQERKINPDFLQRTMRALASQGIFKMVSKDGNDGMYDHTEASRLLEDPNGIIGLVEFMTCPMVFSGFKNLSDTITMGAPQGPSPVGSYSMLNLVPKVREIMAMYNKSVAIGRKMSTNVFVDDFDLSRYEIKTFVELGGDGGHLTKRLLEKYPSIEYGVNVDNASNLTKATTARYREESGDWTKSFKTTEQCYFSCFQMHELDDSVIMKLLTNIASKLKSTRNKFFLVEPYISESNEMSFGAVLDLNMMHCIRNGKLRTDSEWKQLIEKANLKIESRSYHPNQVGVIVISK